MKAVEVPLERFVSKALLEKAEVKGISTCFAFDSSHMQWVHSFAHAHAGAATHYTRELTCLLSWQQQTFETMS